eukprot:3169533-Amphidinium_carterae.1
MENRIRVPLWMIRRMGGLMFDVRDAQKFLDMKIWLNSKLCWLNPALWVTLPQVVVCSRPYEVDGCRLDPPVRTPLLLVKEGKQVEAHVFVFYLGRMASIASLAKEVKVSVGSTMIVKLSVVLKVAYGQGKFNWVHRVVTPASLRELLGGICLDTPGRLRDIWQPPAMKKDGVLLARVLTEDVPRIMQPLCSVGVAVS